MTLQERMLIEAGFLPKKMNKDENEPSSLVSDEALSFIENQLGIDRDTFLEIISDEANKEQIYDALVHCLENVPELSDTASELLQLMAETGREDEDPSEELDWITIKGTHIPLDDGGNITGKVAEKIKETSKKVSDHFTESSATSSDKDFEREGYRKNVEGHWEKSKFEISDSVKPTNSDYEYDPADTDKQFINKNVDKLMPIFEEKGMDGVRDEWLKTRLQKSTGDFKEVGDAEIDAILDRDIDQGAARLWIQEYDPHVKGKLAYCLTKNSEVHNAALNIMYKNYKDYCKMQGQDAPSYEDFLVTPVKMYRGGSGKEHKSHLEFSSYTFDKEAAQKFKASNEGHGRASDDGVIYEADIRPIDTFGSLNTSGEMEIFVPGFMAPNGKYDSEDDVRIDDEPENGEDWVTIKGTHVMIDENGVAQSGGKLKGKTFKDAKSQKKPAGSKQSNVEHVRNVVMKLEQMKRPRMSDYETYEEFEEARNAYKQERDNLRKEVAQYANDSLNRESKYDSMEKVKSWAEEKYQKMQSRYEAMQRDYYRGFPISEKEEEKIKAWKEKHDIEKHYADTLEKRLKLEGVSGGRFKYIFVPTSIGISGCIQCNCGEKFYFQDFDF